MNPTSIEPPLPALQPPQPPQPNRLSTSCDLHPDEHFTGFCPACLCERLSSLHPNNNTTTTTTTTTSRFKPPTSSTAAAALKAIFKPSNNNNNNNNKPSNSSSLLRRTQSFSASKNEGLSSCSVFEPQRKSCDVRVKNTLSCLFNQNNNIQEDPFAQKDSHVLENTNLASSSVQVPVVEGKSGQEEEYIEVSDDQLNVHVAGRASVSEDRVQEIVEEEEEEEEEEEGGIEQGQEELKPMKDYIDIDSQTKKSSGRPSIWSAASVFSKKLQKWRQKQKMKKQRSGGGSARLPVEKPIGRQLRDTQSEIADYGYGRRSCDTDPRFSLDIGRMSFDVPRMSFDAARMSLDDPRYSFDEPRASWDGYLIGRTMPLPPRMPTRLSVVEDAPPPPPPPPHVHVLRSDMQIPVEEFPKGSSSDYEIVPGGTVQTRDYYLDSSTRRRKSLDRSSSIKNTAAAVVAEVEEMKGTSSANPKVSHNDHLPGSKFVVERDANSNYSSSLRDDGSERFDTGFRDNASVAGNCEGKGGKKSSRWSKAWSIWGLINKKGGTKDECEDDRFSRVNGVERSYSESWQGARGERNGEARGNFDPKMFRSNSSVAWRNSSNFGGSFSSVRNCGVEAQGQGRKKRDEFVLERNQSARYSTSSIDNGLLRFYLNPMSDSQRNGFGKSRSGHAQSIARRVLRLY